VYHGSQCALWNPDNPFGCWWNATVQAFNGPDCEYNSTLACACQQARQACRLTRSSLIQNEE
jgi:hypothetical protein